MAVAIVTSAIAFFAPTGAQAADCTYVDVVVVLKVDSNVEGGKTVPFSATTTAGNIDGNWTVKYSGAAAGDSGVRTGTGTSFSGSFKSKVVSKSTPTSMTATFSYCNGATASDVASVTLSPAGGADDGDALPNTGGSNLSWVLIGGALVLVGGGVTFASRRRHSAR
ncbi:MAG: LPXTG cell wall anchor domain-containing protein [Aeromicrobium sp.]